MRDCRTPLSDRRRPARFLRPEGHRAAAEGEPAENAALRRQIRQGLQGKPVACEKVYAHMEWYGRAFAFPAVYSTAWLAEDGTRAQIFVNPGDKEQICTVEGREITVPARDAVMIEL